MNQPLRAGVIGASGVGKHHAKWLNALGCDVVAFAGTSDASVQATAEALRAIFPFAGQGYVGAEAMLAAQPLDLVCLCSPAECHPEHFRLAAETGCHIMCEKPLVWDAQKPIPQLLDEAARMVALARRLGLLAAVNTQYVAAVPAYERLCAQVGKPVRPDAFYRFFMQMDSRGGKHGAAGEKIWLDLASHPLSLLMALAGPGRIAPGTETCEIGPTQTDARFIYRMANNRQVQAQIRVRNLPEGPLVRQFGVDDVLADYEGRNDEQGVFWAHLKLAESEVRDTDFVQTSLTRFVAAVRGEATPLATVEDGLANLQMQLRLLEVGRKISG